MIRKTVHVSKWEDPNVFSTAVLKSAINALALKILIRDVSASTPKESPVCAYARTSKVLSFAVTTANAMTPGTVNATSLNVPAYPAKAIVYASVRTKVEKS